MPNVIMLSVVAPFLLPNKLTFIYIYKVFRQKLLQYHTTLLALATLGHWYTNKIISRCIASSKVAKADRAKTYELRHEIARIFAKKC